MNGSGTRRAYGFEQESPAAFRDVMPTGRAMADGYRDEIVNGFGAELPRYNPVSRAL